MPCWYYDKKELKNTPSAMDGIDFETESRYRKEGARFIIDTGTKMDLGYNTMATGVVYFHRFYMFHSFRQFPRYVTACCCLFLAGKVEETPKKCKDIIKTARSLLTDQKFATFGEDPKEEVMTLERILLQTIKFDLQVEHPYGYLIRYAKCLKGDKQKLQKMVQMAWTFVNDSLCTTLSLQWEPEIIAVALMYLAGKLSQFEVVDWSGRTSKHLRWWDMFVEDVTMDLLENICHQVLDLYSSTSTQAPDSPPLAPRLNAGAGGTSTAPLATTPVKANPQNGQDAAAGAPELSIESSSQAGAAVPPPLIKANPLPDIPAYPYQTFSANPFTSAYPPAVPAVGAAHLPAPPPPGPPLPHLSNAQLTQPPPAAAVYPPYLATAPPGHFAAAVAVPPSYYQAPPGVPPHRPYYPPST